jgi:putative sigma-54 modulation protein
VPLALAAAADKIDRQAAKLKDRWAARKRQGISPARAASAAPRPERAGARNDGNGGARVVRARRYEVKPMSVEEAAYEVADDAHAFLVFRNAATDTINVLFRRPDGRLGLIEPDA